MGRDVVVVLSYRGRADTETCVASLLAEPDPPTVLVVDNGSDDGVLDSVRNRWPDVRTHQTGANLGFAGGMNAGLRAALAESPRTVTILNNDTVVPAGAIRALADRAERGELVSPTVLRDGDGDSTWFAGGVIDPATGVAEHAFGDRLGELPVADGVRRSEVLAGCCLTASAQTWERLGLLDERYFLIFEDSDLSVRARDLGIPRTVLTTTHIRHRVSASFHGAMEHLGTYYFVRNALLFTSEHTDGSLRTRWRLLRTRVLPSTTAAVRTGNWRAAGRHAVLLGAAGTDHLRGRYGRAPDWLERRAQRWSR